MGKRVRAFDWASTALGSPEQWPVSLRTLVNLLLASTQPMFVAWGPERTWLYNDAFIPILGRKHPEALGRQRQGSLERGLGRSWTDVRSSVRG